MSGEVSMVRKHRHHRHIHGVATSDMVDQRLTAATEQDRNAVLRAFGSVVYAVRLPGNVVKIGYTSDLPRRASDLGAEELLAFRPGSYADEQLIHRSLVPHRHHGREYYHPVPEVLALVNEMRDDLGLEPVAI